MVSPMDGQRAPGERLLATPFSADSQGAPMVSVSQLLHAPTPAARSAPVTAHETGGRCGLRCDTGIRAAGRLPRGCRAALMLACGDGLP